MLPSHHRHRTKLAAIARGHPAVFDGHLPDLGHPAVFDGHLLIKDIDHLYLWSTE